MSALIDTVTPQPNTPTEEQIEEAAQRIQRGELVAFPTETVYGLGANALNAEAVARIFAAKGRPATNPVIVHVIDLQAAKALVADWPEVADRLSAAFWPGPLTLVLPRLPIVPPIVTAGGETVAIRVPAHPVALRLLSAAGLPIAAPSANRSSEISPTRAEHVRWSLGHRVETILDGGPTTGGIESTVLSLVGSQPRLLRPGLVTVARIEEVIGPVAFHREPSPGNTSSTQPPAMSPGLMSRHYAPHARLILAADGSEHVRLALRRGDRIGWLRLSGDDSGLSDETSLVCVSMPLHPDEYAARLYDTLHMLDGLGVTIMVADRPPDTADWFAIHDRLTRAATPE